MVNLGERIRKFRVLNGMSQKEVADIANLYLEDKMRVSADRISLYELGKSYPSLHATVAIADALMVPVNELIGRSISVSEFSTDELLKEIFRRMK